MRGNFCKGCIPLAVVYDLKSSAEEIGIHPEPTGEVHKGFSMKEPGFVLCRLLGGSLLHIHGRRVINPWCLRPERKLFYGLLQAAYLLGQFSGGNAWKRTLLKGNRHDISINIF